MAQHVEVVLAFPRLRAIVVQNGRARAVAARCSSAEKAALLSASGLARPVVPVHEDGFRDKCASVTARISGGDLQLTAHEPEQARQWCCGSQVFNEELSLDGCCRMLVARAVLAIKGQRLSPAAVKRFGQVAAVLKSATLHAALPEWPDRMELVASVLAQPHAPLPVCLEQELCSGDFVLVGGESSFLSDVLQLPEAQGESVRARCVVEMLSGFALNGQSEAFVQLLLRAGTWREGLEEAGVCVLRVARGGSEERQDVKIPHTDGSEWVHAKMLRSQDAAQEQQDAHEAWLAMCTCLLEAYGVGDQTRTAGHRKACFTVDTGRKGVARVLGATEQASAAWEARQVIEARLTEIGIRPPSMNFKGEFILRLPLRTEWTPDEHQKPWLDAACQHALNFRSMGPETASAAGGFISRMSDNVMRQYIRKGNAESSQRSQSKHDARADLEERSDQAIKDYEEKHNTYPTTQDLVDYLFGEDHPHEHDLPSEHFKKNPGRGAMKKRHRDLAREHGSAADNADYSDGRDDAQHDQDQEARFLHRPRGGIEVV
jgi:hypothetical protein